MITKQKKQLWIIQVTTQYSKLSLCKPLNGVIFINSAIIFSYGLHASMFYVKYFIQVSTK